MPWRAPSQLAANLCRESSIEKKKKHEGCRGAWGGSSTHTPLMFYSLYRPFLVVCRQDEPVVMREGGTCAGEGQGRCSGREPSSWASSPGDAAVPLHNFRGPPGQRTHATTKTRPTTRAIRCFEPSPGRRHRPGAYPSEAPASLLRHRHQQGALPSGRGGQQHAGNAPRPVQHVCLNVPPPPE